MANRLIPESVDLTRLCQLTGKICFFQSGYGMPHAALGLQRNFLISEVHRSEVTAQGIVAHVYTRVATNQIKL